MRKPGGLPSMGSHRAGHNWSDLAVAATDGKESAWNAGNSGLSLGRADSLEKEWLTTPAFFPGEFHGQSESGLVDYSPWDHKD